MENYFYKCPVCGFIHLVPAYWVSYEPAEEITFEHLDIKNSSECSNQTLYLLIDENE